MESRLLDVINEFYSGNAQLYCNYRKPRGGDHQAKGFSPQGAEAKEMTLWGGMTAVAGQGDHSEWLRVRIAGMHPVWGWCVLPLVFPREQITVRRALMGETEGGIEFSSNCPLCQYQH